MSVPKEDVSFEDGVNVCFSTVPTDIVFIFLIAFIIRRTTRTLVLAFFLPILAGLNRTIEVILAGYEHCSRPATSCVRYAFWAQQ